MPLVYENLVKDNKTAFIAKVKKVSSNLGIDPNWLMVVMKNESGISPTEPNPIGCVGLIQFCSTTPAHLGTSKSALLSMSNVQQLDYVEKFYKPKAGKYDDFTDLYLYAFLPIMFDEPDSKVIPEKYYSANNLINRADFDKDKKVTVGEWRRATRALFPKDAQAYIEPVFWNKSRKQVLFFAILASLVGFGYFCYHKKILMFKENG